MINYNVIVRKNESVAKCRLCHKQINVGSICVFVDIDDGFSPRKMVTHSDCFLSFIIKEVKKIQLKDLEEGLSKFNAIEKLLTQKKKKEKGGQK